MWTIHPDIVAAYDRPGARAAALRAFLGGAPVAKPARDVPRPVEYSREAVLTVEQLAAALHIHPKNVGKLDLPVVYLGTQSPRWVWGQVLDVLMERARRHSEETGRR